MEFLKLVEKRRALLLEGLDKVRRARRRYTREEGRGEERGIRRHIRGEQQKADSETKRRERKERELSWTGRAGRESETDGKESEFRRG